jgi:DnaJ-class molecular chaperone
MNSDLVTCLWCEGAGVILVDRWSKFCRWEGTEHCVGCGGTGLVDPNEKEEETSK